MSDAQVEDYLANYAASKARGTTPSSSSAVALPAPSSSIQGQMEVDDEGEVTTIEPAPDTPTDVGRVEAEGETKGKPETEEPNNVVRAKVEGESTAAPSSQPPKAAPRWRNRKREKRKATSQSSEIVLPENATIDFISEPQGSTERYEHANDTALNNPDIYTRDDQWGALLYLRRKGSRQTSG